MKELYLSYSISYTYIVTYFYVHCHTYKMNFFHKYSVDSKFILSIVWIYEGSCILSTGMYIIYCMSHGKTCCDYERYSAYPMGIIEVIITVNI